MSRAAQLALALPHRPALGRADFLVSTVSQEAVAWIDRWPDWSAHVLVLTGPLAGARLSLVHPLSETWFRYLYVRVAGSYSLAWPDRQGLGGDYLATPTGLVRWSGLKGSIARCRARLMAVARNRWCLVQTPVLRFALIMNRCEV